MFAHSDVAEVFDRRSALRERRYNLFRTGLESFGVKLFRKLLHRIKDHWAGTEEPLAHVNHVIISDCLELVPSGVGFEIFHRNPPMGATDQQDEVRGTAQDFLQADLGPRLGQIGGNRFASGSRDNIINVGFAAGGDHRVIPNHDENLWPR